MVSTKPLQVKQADAAGQAFADAVQAMAAQQLKADALKDVGSMALLGAGVGAAGRGLVGLVNLMRTRPKKTRSGPATLALPYPVAPTKLAGFLSGDAASTKAGVPWYGPAMLGAGLGSLALGWKGLDVVLNRRRERQQREELDSARQEFHDALMGSYAKPVSISPDLVTRIKRAGEPTAMEKVGAALDALFGKVAVDWSNLGGAALGGYGMYAGLSGLMAGALVYDKMQKRSRRAVLEKAMQRRERRKFMQSPTEIMAVPEPVAALPAHALGRRELRLITEPTGG